jgi:hypothetical protein
MGVFRLEKETGNTEITSMSMGVFITTQRCMSTSHSGLSIPRDIAPGIQKARRLHSQSTYGGEGNTHSPCWE